MKEYVNENVYIKYSDDVPENFIKQTTNILNERKKYFVKLFNCDSSFIPQIHTAIFTNRNEFSNHIKNITNGKITPPQWAAGCFYNNEIQILINKNKKDFIKKSKYILPHEMSHLFIKKCVYEKYSIPRLKWWDECYAYYLESKKNDKYGKELLNYCEDFKNILPFDLNNITKTTDESKYNVIPIYRIVGFYIFNNNLQQKYIDTIIKSRTEMQEIGKTLFEKAIKYLEQKYNKEIIKG